MNVNDLKKQLQYFPYDLELFINVEYVEEEDCGNMPITAIHMSITEDGTSGVFEFDTPYM